MGIYANANAHCPTCSMLLFNPFWHNIKMVMAVCDDDVDAGWCGADALDEPKT